MHKDIQPGTALIAMNAFKGSLTNAEACQAVSEALEQKNIRTTILPVGDGGRGTLKTVMSALGGEVVQRTGEGPLGSKIETSILCHPDAKNPTFLFIESSDTCGYHLVAHDRRDPMRASSHGLGVIIKHALVEWKTSLRKIYVGLGDSSISDAGMGMLHALGWAFFDQGGKPLWGNAEGLRHVRSFRTPAKAIGDGVKFIVLCDVLNPLCGRNGSAQIFSPQKGATPQQVVLIEQGMENFAKLIKEQTGWTIGNQPMSGSAGGLASAFRVFLNAELVHGARFVLDWIEFDKLLSGAAFLVTGEGKTDSQTLSGKGPSECLTRAEQLGKKAVIISGKLEPGYEKLLENGHVLACAACGDQPSAKDALKSKALEIFSDESLVNSLKTNF